MLGNYPEYMTLYMTFVLSEAYSIKARKSGRPKNKGFHILSVHQWTNTRGFESHKWLHIKARSRKAYGPFLFSPYITSYMTWKKLRKMRQKLFLFNKYSIYYKHKKTGGKNHDTA